ncbi:hypothetical protein [Sporolactobacillus pectinivorans]|uniref:hypothetical protein n=1 Tax=Sporolactobacillus pectinivorans TaxID=1591408 RepID=UPI0012FE341E|nr:hypothetical protein [Sporolactobacillus pectinivorans]
MELREAKGSGTEGIENDEVVRAEKAEIRLNRKLLLTNCALAVSIIINVKLFLG